MASCKNCIHDEVCNIHGYIDANECACFKNKSEYAEVKHGEWKKVECGIICTNCHKVYDEDFEFSHKVIKEYFKRCPECGAKMDGERK